MCVVEKKEGNPLCKWGKVLIDVLSIFFIINFYYSLYWLFTLPPQEQVSGYKIQMVFLAISLFLVAPSVIWLRWRYILRKSDRFDAFSKKYPILKPIKSRFFFAVFSVLWMFFILVQRRS